MEDIEVLPGSPESVAVSRRNVGFSPRHEGVAVYDNGVPRDVATPRHTGSNVIEFAGSTLYGYNNETTEFGLRTMVVDSSGVTVSSVQRGLISGFGVDIAYDGGLIFTTSGRVVDPVAGVLLGSLSVSGPVASDAANGKAYYGAGADTSTEVQVFDVDTFALSQSVPLPGALGSPTAIALTNEESFAVGTSGGQLYLQAVDEALPPPPQSALHIICSKWSRLLPSLDKPKACAIVGVGAR